jgi:dTDP-4-dehydrorhamnose reductase
MFDQRKTRVLVLGANGMLGSALFRAFSTDRNLATFGTIRGSDVASRFSFDYSNTLIPHIGFEGESGLVNAFVHAQPDIVINCVGIIKQLPNTKNYLDNLGINATLPHRLAKYCEVTGARLIHFSTDCVFSGKDGSYRESDFPDANDLYGRSKFLGEVNYDNSVTLRTSIIGHELNSSKSLVDWFLNQKNEIKGFKRAIFSGLPTVEVSRVVRDFVMPNKLLKGLYHLSVDPISKFDLLQLIGQTYGCDTNIRPDEQLVVDRSLNSERFQAATGFTPKPWPQLISEMHLDYLSNVAYGT